MSLTRSTQSGVVVRAARIRLNAPVAAMSTRYTGAKITAPLRGTQKRIAPASRRSIGINGLAKAVYLSI